MSGKLKSGEAGAGKGGLGLTLPTPMPWFLLAQVKSALRSERTGAIEPLTDLLKKEARTKERRPPVGCRLMAPFDRSGRCRCGAWRARLSFPRNDRDLAIALGLAFRQAKEMRKRAIVFEKAHKLAPDNLWRIDQFVELDLQDKPYDAARQRNRQTSVRKNPNVPAAHLFRRQNPGCGKKVGCRGGRASNRRSSSILIIASRYDLLVQTYLARNKLPQAANQLQADCSRKPQQYAGPHDARAGIRAHE